MDRVANNKCFNIIKIRYTIVEDWIAREINILFPCIVYYCFNTITIIKSHILNVGATCTQCIQMNTSHKCTVRNTVNIISRMYIT